MLLFPIIENKWAFFAAGSASKECSLLVFLSNLNKKYHGSRNNILTIIKRSSESPEGPRLLPDDICHSVDSKEKIFEFIAGDIRLLWFYSTSARKVIICSHAFIKKSRKTPRKEINKAIAVKKKYKKAVEEHKILIKSDKEAGDDT